MRFSPVVDGWFLPADTHAIFAQGQQNDVPLLTGLTADEGSSAPTYGKLKAAAFKQQAQERSGAQAAAFLKLSPSDDDGQSGQAQKQSAREQGLISMHLWAAERARTSQAKVLHARHPVASSSRTTPPSTPRKCPYVFGNLKLLHRSWAPLDRQLSATMMAYWVNFATTGDPNGQGLPAWPTFDAKSHTMMELGAQTGTRIIADAARFEFFEKSLAQQRSQ